ncbi:MAG: hypothetical protein ACR2KZ_09810 [Segetibacter sp.]
MQTSSFIQFLKNKEIDKSRWDDCILQGANTLIYARTFYLNHISTDWNALVGANYEWVLPLTNRKKYGISYLYQPAFAQQLGVFFKPGVTVPYKAIFEYLQQHYKFWEINWNYAASTELTDSPHQVDFGNNFIIDLSASYETIAANYHNDLVKNLKRSNRFRHFYKTTHEFNKSIELYKQYYGKRMPHVKETDYHNFCQISAYAAQNEIMVCREVLNENNELMATALLLFDGKRLYNLMNTTTEAGRITGANHFLINAIIEEFSGKKVILDFEGSDLQGVKNFYEKFGAVNQPYFRVKYNCLPWPLKLFKR